MTTPIQRHKTEPLIKPPSFSLQVLPDKDTFLHTLGITSRQPGLPSTEAQSHDKASQFMPKFGIKEENRALVIMPHFHRSFTRENPCAICGACFKQRSSLYVHMRMHEGKYRYKCPYCGKGHSATVNLKQHMRHHLGRQTLGCVQCDLDFNSLKELEEHLKTCKSKTPQWVVADCYLIQRSQRP